MTRAQLNQHYDPIVQRLPRRDAAVQNDVKALQTRLQQYLQIQNHAQIEGAEYHRESHQTTPQDTGEF